jgi:hypothetical protein
MYIVFGSLNAWPEAKGNAKKCVNIKTKIIELNTPEKTMAKRVMERRPKKAESLHLLLLSCDSVKSIGNIKDYCKGKIFECKIGEFTLLSFPNR